MNIPTGIENASSNRSLRPREIIELHFSFVTEKIDISIDKNTIFDVLRAYGDIHDVVIKKQEITKRPQCQSGYGFAAYSSLVDVLWTVRNLRGVTVHGVEYDCQVARRSLDKVSQQEIAESERIVEEMAEKQRISGQGMLTPPEQQGREQPQQEMSTLLLTTRLSPPPTQSNSSPMSSNASLVTYASMLQQVPMTQDQFALAMNRIAMTMPQAMPQQSYQSFPQQYNYPYLMPQYANTGSAGPFPPYKHPMQAALYPYHQAGTIPTQRPYPSHQQPLPPTHSYFPNQLMAYPYPIQQQSSFQQGYMGNQAEYAMSIMYGVPPNSTHSMAPLQAPIPLQYHDSNDRNQNSRRYGPRDGQNSGKMSNGNTGQNS